MLAFAHPCGIEYELIGIADDARKPYSNGEVPAELAIRRAAHHRREDVREMEPTQEFMDAGWVGPRSGARRQVRALRSARAAPASSSTMRWKRPCRRPAGPMAPVPSTIARSRSKTALRRTTSSAGSRALASPTRRNARIAGISNRSTSVPRAGPCSRPAVSKPEAFLIDEPYETLGAVVQIAPQFESQRESILRSLESLKY
ncbi:hypothetical protein ACTMU2_19550 [Cupriavidus basilensis]